MLSDRELVTFDAGQFARVDTQLGAMVNALWAINEQLKQQRDASLLTAINNLSRKMEEFMATQEERLRTIQGQLSGIADGINTLQQQLADLKANNPELDDEISAIEATVTAIRDDLNPPAPVEPAPEG